MTNQEHHCFQWKIELRSNQGTSNVHISVKLYSLAFGVKYEE